MMRFMKLVACAAFCLCAGLASAASKWTNHYSGGNEKLMYDSQIIEETRQRIDRYPWAEKLYQRLKRELAQPEVYYKQPDDYGDDLMQAHWVRDAALCYRIDGDECHIDEVVKRIVKYFMLHKMDKPRFNPDTTRVNQYFWSWGLHATFHLAAYDMIKNHHKMLPYRNAMKSRIEEVIREGLRYERNIRRLGNTQFWGVTTLGVFGFMADDAHAIDVAINGKNGFKQSMLRCRDEARFWPEPIHYIHGYVDACMMILAETARKNNYPEDLYHYTAPNGASILRTYESFIEMVNPDGFAFANGDHGEWPILMNGEVKIEGTPVLPSGGKATWCAEYQYHLYHKIYGTPLTAWLVSLNPARDEKHMTFWGYSALTHGEEVTNAQVPEVHSVIYPEMGSAYIKSVEGRDYWNSGALTAHMRNGASQQFHSNNDHFAIVINAFHKNIYNHWFTRWDYLCPRKGRANHTPLSQRIVNHNTVMVDCQEPSPSLINYRAAKPEVSGLPFSKIERQGDMQRVSCEGEVYAGVWQRRTICTTREYVLDLFELRSDTPHVYDYMLHSLGQSTFKGVSEWQDYPQLATEYRLREIDSKSTREDRWWLMNTRKAAVKEDLSMNFLDEDKVGIYTTLFYEPDTQFITTELPYYVSTKGWDASRIFPRRPMVVVRREAKNTMFVAVHQPYKGIKSKPFKVKRDGNIVTVKGVGFVDTYDLETGVYLRK